MNHEVFKIGRSSMIRLYQLFKNKQIKILQVEQLEIQSCMTFTTVKLTRRRMPLYVDTRASAQWQTGQGTGQRQVTLICVHPLLQSSPHYSRFALYKDHCSGPEEKQGVS